MRFRERPPSFLAVGADVPYPLYPCGIFPLIGEMGPSARHTYIIGGGEIFMASGQTTNYGLNQWTSEDAVLREEFNLDNKKIDAVLNSCGFAIGSYYGTNSAADDAGQDIDVGFEPTAVIIGYQSSGGEYGTFITRDRPLMYGEKALAKIIPTGFRVALASSGGHTVTPYTDLGGPYIYIAFR